MKINILVGTFVSMLALTACVPQAPGVPTVPTPTTSKPTTPISIPPVTITMPVTTTIPTPTGTQPASFRTIAQVACGTGTTTSTTVTQRNVAITMNATTTSITLIKKPVNVYHRLAVGISQQEASAITDNLKSLEAGASLEVPRMYLQQDIRFVYEENGTTIEYFALSESNGTFALGIVGKLTARSAAFVNESATVKISNSVSFNESRYYFRDGASLPFALLNHRDQSTLVGQRYDIGHGFFAQSPELFSTITFDGSFKEKSVSSVTPDNFACESTASVYNR